MTNVSSIDWYLASWCVNWFKGLFYACYLITASRSSQETQQELVLAENHTGVHRFVTSMI